jgi:dephospho-CoA kinase
MARLEAIVHPAVRAAREAFLEKCSDAPLLVFDVPLLFETGQADDFDVVVVVSCGPEIQRERVLSRPDMTIERFEAILEFQMPDEEKRSRATYVIDTSRPLEETKDQVAELVRKLTD